MRNPLLSSAKNLHHYLMVWVVVMAAHAKVLYFFYNIELLPAIADAVVYNLFFAGMGFSFWYFTRYLGIHTRNPFYVLVNHILAGFIFICMWIAEGYYVLKIIDSIANFGKEYMLFLDHSIAWRFTIGILFYSITILIYYLYIYYISFKEKLTRESELSHLVKETELNLLKSQLNPHFIFNSLNSVSSLTISNPLLAQEMVIKLSSFLRFALDQEKNQVIPFSRELENSLLYLDIEKTRFGNKLVFQKEVQEECHRMLLPNMILQPLLENAIKHGVHESLSPALIHLSAKGSNHFLHIKISNTFEKDGSVKKRKGIGLRNVKERLHLLYGKNDLIKTSESEITFTVELFIPQ